MVFRYYSNMVSHASRNIAGGVFVLGLMLIGFGFLIYVLRDLFALIFAAMFCAAGIGCGITALKILWALHRLNKFNSGNSGPSYRENVRIHTEEHYDI